MFPPLTASPSDLIKLPSADINVCLYPEIAELASCLQALSIGPVAMSGSGATLFIAVKSVTQANHWQTLIQEQRPDVWTTITHTIPEAYHIVTTPTHP